METHDQSGIFWQKYVYHVGFFFFFLVLFLHCTCHPFQWNDKEGCRFVQECHLEVKWDHIVHAVVPLQCLCVSQSLRARRMGCQTRLSQHYIHNVWQLLILNVEIWWFFLYVCIGWLWSTSTVGRAALVFEHSVFLAYGRRRYFQSVKGFIHRWITNIKFQRLKKEHFVQKQFTKPCRSHWFWFDFFFNLKKSHWLK